MPNEVISLKTIKQKLKYLKRKLDEVLQSYQFIGYRQNNDQLLPEFEKLQNALKDFLLQTKHKAEEIEQKFLGIKGKSSPILEKSILKSWSQCEQDIVSTIEKIRKDYASSISALPKDHDELLEIILADVDMKTNGEQTIYDAYNATIKLLNKQLEKTLTELAGKIIEKVQVANPQKTPEPPQKTPEPPSCFICYAWGNPSNSKKVHKLAELLKLAGINVILDIWDNQSNSVSVFTAKLMKADFVLVMGTPSLQEKWENYVTQGRSRNKIDAEYRGSVVCRELEKLEGRLAGRDSENHGVMGLLLSGEHPESFPEPVKALASDALDFKDWNNLHVPLFNLLSILYKKDNHLKIIVSEAKKDFLRQIHTVKQNNVEASHKIGQKEISGTAGLSAATASSSQSSDTEEFKAFQERYFQEVNDKRLAHQLAQEDVIEPSESDQKSVGETEYLQECQPEVNVNYWYRDDDINTYLETMISKLGGYVKQNNRDCSYLLQGTSEDGCFIDAENNAHYVLVTPAIDTEGKAAPIDYHFDKTKQPEPASNDQDDRRDIFDELMPLLKASNCHMKILFPYNLTQRHWLTGEVEIIKKPSSYQIMIYAHDPYGEGQMVKANYDILENHLQTRLQSPEIEKIECQRATSELRRRQAIEDSTSCGVIVAEELVKRIRGKQLTTTQYPVGALSLREQQLKTVMEALSDDNASRQKFIEHTTINNVAPGTTSLIKQPVEQLKQYLMPNSTEEE